jgi:hypothetical protein
MSSGGGKSKADRKGGEQNGYAGLERRAKRERRAAQRREGSRRYVPRRLDERRGAGIGEVMDDRRNRARDRRKDERRRVSRRNADRRTPPGRRTTDSR